MAQTLIRAYGDFELPVDNLDVTDEQLLSVFDPGRDQLLSLFKTAINAELGKVSFGGASVDATSVWAVATRTTPLEGALPVVDTMWEMPRRSVLREREIKYPLLTIYRTEATEEDFSLHLVKTTQTWGLDYILGPLDGAGARRLIGTLNGVKNIINLVIVKHGHPEFEAGVVQFGSGKGGFDTLATTASSQGLANFADQNDGHEFYALSMTLVTTELDDDVDGADTTFEGATVTVGVGGSEGIVPDVIIARTEVPVQNPKVGP